MNTVPVIVFNAHKRKYISVGEHPVDSDSVAVLEKHGKASADELGDEYNPVWPHNMFADGRAVRLYNRKSAVDTASWNFKSPGNSLNLPEPVSVEDDPVACVESPKEFFPNAKALCWCVPGFEGDNERHADYPDELKDFISKTFIDNIGEWTNRIRKTKTRKRADAAIKKPAKKGEFGFHICDEIELDMMHRYLDECYVDNRDTSFPAQAKLADPAIMAEYLETIGDFVVKRLEWRFRKIKNKKRGGKRKASKRKDLFNEAMAFVAVVLEEWEVGKDYKVIDEFGDSESVMDVREVRLTADDLFYSVREAAKECDFLDWKKATEVQLDMLEAAVVLSVHLRMKALGYSQQETCYLNCVEKE